MFSFFKKLFRRSSIKEDDPVVLLVRSEMEGGCSKRAASLLLDMYKSGRISGEIAAAYAYDLQYCNDIEELVRRFAVCEKPEEEKKDYGTALNPVIGAMYGDIIGSMFEGMRITDISPALEDMESPAVRLTDDSILTVATLQAECRGARIEYYGREMGPQDMGAESSYPVRHNPYTDVYKKMARKFPTAGYGSHFIGWAEGNDDRPYGSLGNGSAMRVSPIGALHDDIQDVVERAAVSAMATHNHVEGVKGAVVTAVCIWMARKGYSKRQIFEYMKKHYSYGASTRIFTDFSYKEAITSVNYDHIKCSYSVPAAVISFYESRDFADAIRLSACVGYDTDTNACICGGIAGAYYGVPDEAVKIVKKKSGIVFGKDIDILHG